MMDGLNQNKVLRDYLEKFNKEDKIYILKLLGSSPLPIALCDEKLNIIAASTLLCNKLSYSSEEINEKNLKDLSNDSYQYFKKAFSRLPSQEKAEIKNIELKDSKNKVFGGSALLSSLTHNRVVLTIIYFLNLESKKENQLITDTGKLDSFLYEQTRRGKWLLDINSRNFFGNEICFSLLGIQSKSGIANFRDVLDLIASKEDRDNFEKDLLKLHKNSTATEKELRLKSDLLNSNTSRYIRFIMNRFDFPGEDLVAGTVDDITEFKRVEKDLFKSRTKLEKADRFKSVFLTNLSHEIRTPMNSILGYSELLSQEGLSTEKINEFTSIIRSKGNYLLTLIDDVIELSRFESGSIEFNYTEFMLLPLLKELHREFEERRIKKEKTGISIELNVPEGADQQTIYADYGRLQQLLSNLLSNALKFTERGKIIFGYKLSSKNFKFFVSDTGQGLSPDDQRRIFNRFETIEETAIRKLSGTGLSLTISKLIIEQLGGKIKVKSELNKGSRFQLNIPIINSSRKKEKVKEEKENLETYNWKDKVILIAEDEDLNYRFLEAVLQKTQAQILRAKNGQEAVELCKKINQIDIVLMDIKMPLLNGYDATIAIRKYRSNLPIIAQTAFASHEETIKCQQVGCDDYITKPIDINILVEKINDQFLK